MNLFSEAASLVTCEARIKESLASLCLDGLEFLNVVGWKLPVLGAPDDKVFVIEIGQGRVGLWMAAIQ